MKGSPTSPSPTSIVGKALFSWEKGRTWLGALPKITQPGRVTELGLLSPRPLLTVLCCLRLLWEEEEEEGQCSLWKYSVAQTTRFLRWQGWCPAPGSVPMSSPVRFYSCLLYTSLTAMNSFLENISLVLFNPGTWHFLFLKHRFSICSGLGRVLNRTVLYQMDDKRRGERQPSSDQWQIHFFGE